MNTKIRTIFTRGALFLPVLALLLGITLSHQNRATAAPQKQPIAIDLCATTGTATMPDGTSVTIWGYALGDCTGSPAATLPGPTLDINAGDTVDLTLYNSLPQETSLALPGQALIPDRVGAAANGGTAQYSFTAAQPGTYRYEAGLTSNGQIQVAMGMFGALIVRPATAGQAYNDPASAFDDEAVIILNEIDPNLNANPTGFDLRDFTPRYRLINGQAFPNTATIDIASPAAGRRLLLRYLNAGLEHHSMGLLGLDQMVLGVDGSPLAYPRRTVAETLVSGQTADMIVTLPASADTAGVMQYPLYDASLMLYNSNSPGFGGMLTFVTVSNGAGNNIGPATNALTLAPNPTDGSVDVTLTATIDDTANGGANIVAAEYFIDIQGVDGTGTPMTAGDGTFDSPTEGVTATLTTAELSLLSGGSHVIYVHGQDAVDGWGAFNFTTLDLDNGGPATTGVTLTPNPSDGSSVVALSATGDDRTSGNNDVTAAEFFIGADPGLGAGEAMIVNGPAPVASLSADVPAGLAEGAYVVSVRSQDSFDNWGQVATATLGIDQTGPDTATVLVAPNPNDGTQPINANNPSVRVDATVTDPLAGGVQSNLERVELFIDYQNGVDADGTGAPMTPDDGLYDSPSEAAYAFVPLTTINALSEGDHTIAVHGQDASGNWGAVSSTILTIDRGGPTISNVAVTPNPSDGAASVTLTAEAADVVNLVAAEWFEGTDPGVGNGAAMVAADGTLDSPNEGLTATIDLTGFAAGDYTLSVRAQDAAGNWSDPDSIILTVSNPPPATGLVYFSTAGNVALAGVAGPFDNADVYSWDGTSFSRVFDASANGLPGNANIDGLTVDGPNLYMTFSVAAGTNVSGLGVVQDEDVVVYDGTTWSLFFTGGPLGLNVANAQNLDAIDIVGGVLYFSTIGNGAIPGVGGPYDDADIYTWDGAAFNRVFDASANGLPGNADIDGLKLVGTDLYLSFDRNAGTNVPGVGNVQDEDVVLYDGTAWSLIFEGGLQGLNTVNNQDLDAIDVAP